MATVSETFPPGSWLNMVPEGSGEHAEDENCSCDPRLVDQDGYHLILHRDRGEEPMPDVPDPDGVTDKSHGGPGCHPRPGYMPLNGPMGDLPGGCHDEDAPENVRESGGNYGSRDGY